MKKLIAIAALLLGLPTFAFALTEDEFAESLARNGGGVGAAVLVVVFILYLAILVLGIILYVKIWMMTNDVRKMRRYMEWKLEHQNS